MKSFRVNTDLASAFNTAYRFASWNSGAVTQVYVSKDLFNGLAKEGSTSFEYPVHVDPQMKDHTARYITSEFYGIIPKYVTKEAKVEAIFEYPDQES